MEKLVQLHWPGKQAAADAAHTPSARALKPDRTVSACFDTTRNLFIEGDNLDALKLLQASYAGQIKLIYIDPPYNTGHEYVYNDDFGRRHADWLSMMYPRLRLARELLTEDGAIFVSIGLTEHAHLIQLLSEVMGEANFRADIVWQKRYTRSNNTRDFTTVVEHIVVFAKSAAFTVNLLPRTAAADARYGNPDNDQRGPWKPASFLNPLPPAQRPNLCYPITNPNTGRVTLPTTHAWRRSQAEYERMAEAGLLYWGTDGRSPVPSVKMFLSEVRGLTPTDFWSHEYAGHTDEGTRDLAALIDGKVFNNPKPVKLMRRVLEHATGPSSVVLDFFAGTGTMAQAVLEMNAADGGSRAFIAVQLPERCDHRSAAYKQGFTTIADICAERIRRAGAALRSAAPAHPSWDGDVGFQFLRAE